MVEAVAGGEGRIAAARSARGVLTIVTGTAGGQLIGLAAAPVLTRIYSPADFGVYTVVFAVSATVATVATLRFDLAVPLPEREADAHSLVLLGLGSALGTAVLGTALVALVGKPLADTAGQPQLMPWLWFVPVIAAIMGGFVVLNQLAVRQRRYGAIARRNLLQALVLAVTQIASGVAGMKPGGMVLGLGIGQAAGAVSLIRGANIGRADLRIAVAWRQLRTVATRYRRFPLVLAPSGLLNVLGLQLPVLIISFRYGPEVAGWLGLSQRVLSLPVMLIGAAVAQVYVGELARFVRDRSAQPRHLFLSATWRLGAIAVAAVAGVALLAPWLFRLVFGSEWEHSGHFAQALALNLGAQLVAVPLSQTLIVYEHQFTQLAWDAGRLILAAGATLICALAGGSAVEAVLAYSLASTSCYIVSWLLSWHTIRRATAVNP